jgi:hypothetical protein
MLCVQQALPREILAKICGFQFEAMLLRRKGDCSCFAWTKQQVFAAEWYGKDIAEPYQID